MPEQPKPETLLVPMEPEQSIQPQPQSTTITAKKPPKLTKKQEQLTRIEKYNVAELCWKYYLNLSREPDDIAMLLNKHLAKKRDVLLREGKVEAAFHFPQMTRMDVRIFLEAQQARIDTYLGNERKRMMESSFDVIKKIQLLAISTEETMAMWRAKLEDALNKDDDRKLRIASRMLKDERAELHKMIKDIAQLLGKVKTYISIDMMHSQVMSIAEIIDRSEDIDDETKLHLIREISVTLDTTAVVH